MNTLEILAMRRAIKAWRDRWAEHIIKDLDASIPDLRAQLFVEVEKIKLADSIRSQRYIVEKLQSLFVAWCKKKEEEILSAAENDLRNQFKRTVACGGAKSEMEIDVSKASLLDLAGATLSGVAAVASIPAIVGFSTATVSAGGILGLLGVTTTVLVTKNIAIGLVVLAVLLLISFIRFSKIVINTKTRLREQIEKQISEKVVYSKKQPSLAMLLTGRIEDTAKQLLGELDHVA